MDIAISRPEILVEDKTRKPRRWDMFLQLNFTIPAIVLLLVLFSAIFAPQIAPYDPLATSLTDRLKPPAFVEGGSQAHLLGTDKLGRDILSRIIWGSRVSLIVAVSVILITGSIGTALGIFGGYFGGW